MASDNSTTRKAGSDEFQDALAAADGKYTKDVRKARMGVDGFTSSNAEAARAKYDDGLEGFTDKEIAMATKGDNFGAKDYLRLEGNKRQRYEIGNDPERLAERIADVDREKYDLSGFTDKQINMALKGGNFGPKDYARLQEMYGGNDAPAPDDGPSDPTPTPTPEPEPTVNITFPGEDSSTPPSEFIPEMKGPGQNIYQDNDINSAVVGDNNTVTNTQDNSIRGFSGSGDWKKAWMQDYFS